MNLRTGFKKPHVRVLSHPSELFRFVALLLIAIATDW